MSIANCQLSTVNCSLVIAHVSELIEQIWFHIHKQLQCKQSIILGLIYFPPNSPIIILDELQDTISEIRNSHIS